MAAASNTAATPLALSSAPALRWPTTDNISGRPPAHATTRAATAALGRASSDSATPARPTPSTTTPATRTSIGTGWDFESRCATSQSFTGDGPRVASMFTPARRMTGAFSTPRANPIATAIASAMTTIAHHGTAAEPRFATTTASVAAAGSNTPKDGAPNRPANAEYSNGSSRTTNPRRRSSIAQ